MTGQTKVTLTGPAKIGDAWFKPGAIVEVDAETLGHLQQACVVDAFDPGFGGLIDLVSGTELIFTQEEFDSAVEAKAQQIAATVFDGALADLAEEAKALVGQAEKLEGENADLRLRAETAEARVTALEADIGGAPSDGAAGEGAAPSEAAPEAAKAKATATGTKKPKA